MTAAFCVACFLSGVAALIFESLWFGLAGLTLGNSVLAASMVLASFMGGLALGNILLARYGHRISSTVRFYAFLEFSIGISGALLVLAFPHLAKVSAAAFRPFLDSP